MSAVSVDVRRASACDPLAEMIERLTREYTGTLAGGAVLRYVARTVRASRTPDVTETRLAQIVEPLVRQQLEHRFGTSVR